MRILVVKMSALGDVVQALPVIRALQRCFDGVQVDWLVEEPSAPVVLAHPRVDRVFLSGRGRWSKGLRRPQNWGRILEEVKGLIRSLRHSRYDLAIDLQGLVKSGVWMRVAHAETKVGYGGTRENGYLRWIERIEPVDRELHAVERYLSLVESLGGSTVEEVDFGLRVPSEASRRLNGILERAGASPARPYAVCVPMASWQSKRWGWSAFSALADHMVEKLDKQVVFTGTAGDRIHVKRIIDGMRQPAANLAGMTDLAALMALLAGARVVVSTDSGPMHLAYALSTPVIALFGPTAPWRTGPYGRGHRVIRARVSCSPCFHRRCAQATCMERIRPEAVAEAVSDVLQRDL